MKTGFFERLTPRSGDRVSVFHNAGNSFESMFLPQQKERSRPELLHQNGCFSVGIEGEQSDCRAVIFDFSLNDLPVGQANGNDRETSPATVLGLDTYGFGFHVEHHKRLL
jgi:hypothetical protein